MMRLTWVLIIAVSMVSCSSEKGNDKENGQAEEKKVESSTEEEMTALLAELDELSADPQMKRGTVDAILSKAVAFSQRFPNNERCPEILYHAAFKANYYAENQRDLGQPQPGYFTKTVEICNQVIEGYPDFKDILAVYNLKVSVLDWELEKNEEATALYQQLIDAYPSDTNQIEQWQFRIDHIETHPLDFIGQ